MKSTQERRSAEKSENIKAKKKPKRKRGQKDINWLEGKTLSLPSRKDS